MDNMNRDQDGGGVVVYLPQPQQSSSSAGTVFTLTANGDGNRDMTAGLTYDLEQMQPNAQVSMLSNDEYSSEYVLQADEDEVSANMTSFFVAAEVRDDDDGDDVEHDVAIEFAEEVLMDGAFTKAPVEGIIPADMPSASAVTPESKTEMTLSVSATKCNVFSIIQATLSTDVLVAVSTGADKLSMLYTALEVCHVQLIHDTRSGTYIVVGCKTEDLCQLERALMNIVHGIVTNVQPPPDGLTEGNYQAVPDPQQQHLDVNMMGATSSDELSQNIVTLSSKETDATLAHNGSCCAASAVQGGGSPTHTSSSTLSVDELPSAGKKKQEFRTSRSGRTVRWKSLPDEVVPVTDRAMESVSKSGSTKSKSGRRCKHPSEETAVAKKTSDDDCHQESFVSSRVTGDVTGDVSQLTAICAESSSDSRTHLESASKGIEDGHLGGKISADVSNSGAERQPTLDDACMISSAGCKKRLRLRHMPSSLRGERTRLLSREYELLTPFRFFCSMCSFKSKREGHLRQHMQLHARDVPILKCTQCSFRTTGASHMTRHRLRVHSLSEFKCSVDGCTYCASSSRLLFRHVAKRHSAPAEASFVCLLPGCSYRAHTEYGLKRHAARHRDVVGNTEGSPVQLVSRYQCSKCSYKTVDRSRFQRHVDSVHTGVRRFLCDVCGQGFKRHDVLLQHSIVHGENQSPTFSYICSVCGRRFRSKSHLTEHQSCHSTVRPFLCDICGASFKTKAIQRKHVHMIHTRPLSHSCPSCDRRFNSSYALKRHSRIHQDRPAFGGDAVTRKRAKPAASAAADELKCDKPGTVESIINPGLAELLSRPTVMGPQHVLNALSVASDVNPSPAVIVCYSSLVN